MEPRALAYENVLFEPIAERCWEVYFAEVLLGTFDANRAGSKLCPPHKTWRRAAPVPVFHDA